MLIPSEYQKEFAQFPPVLQTLVLEELAAGNEIAELSHGFPAAPCGASIMLARQVTTRPREATQELKFYERNGSSYSGEFTDATRHFFVLEPPLPPPDPPDMDAIRAELNAREAASRAAIHRPIHQESPLVEKFRASMEIDYEKWHEGIGYDLSLLTEATAKDLKQIEEIVLSRRAADWRDIEALAAINSGAARAAIKSAFLYGDSAIRMAVHSHAPELIDADKRPASLVTALEQAEIYGGLSQALLEVQDFHPPEIIQTLLRGLMERDGGTAVHFAAMLFYLHGKAPEPFDWNQRPFFLRFNTEDMNEREQATRELCTAIGADPQRCIPPKRRGN